MLKPSANIIKTPHTSNYSLVIAVDFVQDRYHIIEPESFEEE